MVPLALFGLALLLLHISQLVFPILEEDD